MPPKMNDQLIILLLYIFGICWSNSEPLVQVNQGILNGTIEISRNGRKYAAFLGIPYGKSPTGNLRFRNPEPADNWEGIRPADSFGNMCIQSIFGLVTLGKEDCLFLNIYTPLLEFQSTLKDEITNNTLLPVMVWIYGGAFIFGAGETYGAEYLLDKDVILITINYRLGIFGFLSTGDDIAPGNFGLKDQVLALKWVQKNIRAFGGDPNRVTLFGQSAGGVSVALHALSKASNGLFQQYIIQSGSALCPWAYQKSSNFFKYVKDTAAFVKCPLSSSSSLVNCLRKKSAESLLLSSNIVGTITRIGQVHWTPTDEPDAEDAFLTDSPSNLINQNQMKDVPFMSGVVSDEGLLLTGFLYSIDILYTLSKIILKPIINYAASYYFDLDNQIEFIADLEKLYFNKSVDFAEKSEVLENLTNMLTDGFWLYPELRMLEKVTPKMKNSNYFYSFGYYGTINLMSILIGDNRNFGVSHADDVFYLFPIKFGPFKSQNTKVTTTDIKISKLMVDLWTSFATNGIPTSEEFDNPNLWKPYTSQNNNYLQIGNIYNNTDPTVTLSNSLYPKRMNFWRKKLS